MAQVDGGGRLRATHASRECPRTGLMRDISDDSKSALLCRSRRPEFTPSQQEVSAVQNWGF
jgi:hypothetical protein